MLEGLVYKKLLKLNIIGEAGMKKLFLLKILGEISIKKLL